MTLIISEAVYLFKSYGLRALRLFCMLKFVNRGYRIVVIPQFSKLAPGVRFPLPAQNKQKTTSWSFCVLRVRGIEQRRGSGNRARFPVSENIKNRGFLKAEPVLPVKRVRFPLPNVHSCSHLLEWTSNTLALQRVTRNAVLYETKDQLYRCNL